ncbi:MAG: hypothetical protein EBS96_01560 [Spartobacteria bacterium]|nr:hypothetical protein [Spartobacteria bacterium]
MQRKRRGYGRLGRVETRLLSRTLPIVTKEQVAAQRRDALCPSPKVQKQAAFGILSFPHEGGEGVFFWFSMGGRGSFKFISIGFEVVPVSASFWQRATLVDIQRVTIRVLGGSL